MNWAEKNRERSREIKRKSRLKHAKKINAKKRALAKNPEVRKKRYARDKFKFACRRGWIKRKIGKHFHHPDYSRPYYGVWVTPIEHRRIHTDLMKCPPCIDYTDAVNKIRAIAKINGCKKGAAIANNKRWGSK